MFKVEVKICPKGTEWEKSEWFSQLMRTKLRVFIGDSVLPRLGGMEKGMRRLCDKVILHRIHEFYQQHRQLPIPGALELRTHEAETFEVPNVDGAVVLFINDDDPDVEVLSAE